ncbi:tRNA (cytosine(34)-C(5))-methyltransferase [Smittium culicis]|uniref:tRNA (Cytosine(34)-C(5))-methyltransferase n=1 Tax=Smittium culicis TaxID=133412 RepID=A0A1R1YMC6_9FUNG|nr:tRNA (cytosine(34)-C(5))-methyltransferase [Smittium culicis]
MGKKFNKKKGNKRIRLDSDTKVIKPSIRASDIVKENEKFERFYKAQNLFSDSEYDEMLKYFRTFLPTSFRITGTRSQAEDLIMQIKRDYIPYIESVEIDGEKFKPPHEINWYPNGLGWSFEVPKVALKKSTHLNDFHKFLVTESQIGNISRQEAVSMIPPLLLDVRPNQSVLDMCAAPGSKTAQILELMHANVPEGVVPDGIVIANDSSYKRACMLVHQTNRLHSPCLAVTNHNGERFPNIYIENSEKTGSELFRFDRILADVPCSGDGTIRKNPGIWQSWNYKEPIHLHKIQEKLLKRAAYLLKVGGRLVYSTCSMNPIENEAIVANALNFFEGSLELIDVSNELPGLIRKPGLSNWKVFDMDGVERSSDEVVDISEDLEDDDEEESVTPPQETRKSAKGSKNNENAPKTFRPYKSLFPPKNASELNLDRCIRIYPHLQNTGAFFVAVFEKKKEIECANNVKKALSKIHTIDSKPTIEKLDSSVASDDQADNSPDAHQEKIKVDVQDSESLPLPTGKPDCVPLKQTEYKPSDPRIDPSLNENPFVFLDPVKGSLKQIFDFYDFSPSLLEGGFLARFDHDQHRTVYFVSKSLKNLLESSRNKFRMVNTGVKILAKPASKLPGCEFRLVAEGVPLLLPFINSKFVIDMDYDDFKTFLELRNPRFNQLSDKVNNILQQTTKQTSIIVRFHPTSISSSSDVADGENGTDGIENKSKNSSIACSVLKSPIVLPAWRANESISIHIDKNELRSIIVRVLGVSADIGKNNSILVNNSKTSDKFAKVEDSEENINEVSNSENANVTEEKDN